MLQMDKTILNPIRYKTVISSRVNFCKHSLLSKLEKCPSMTNGLASQLFFCSPLFCACLFKRFFLFNKCLKPRVQVVKNKKITTCLSSPKLMDDSSVFVRCPDLTRKTFDCLNLNLSSQNNTCFQTITYNLCKNYANLFRRPLEITR